MRRTSFLCLVVFAPLLSAPASAQSPSYGYYGKGCLWQRQEIVNLRATSLPRIGQSFALVLDAPVGHVRGLQRFALLLSGLSNRRFGRLGLPLDLSAIPGFCGSLRTSIELVSPTDALGGVRFTLPNDRGLIGLRFYQQSLQVELRKAPGYKPARYFRMSRGGAGVVGV